MNLMTRWEPLREFSAMQDRVNRMNSLFSVGRIDLKSRKRHVNYHQLRTPG